MGEKTGGIKIVNGLAFVAVSFIACAALAQAAPAEAEIPAWAPAIVPLLTFAVKMFVEKVIPNALITKIKDQYVPAVAVVAGIVITMVQTGVVDWSQGPVIGLAGIGLHQLFTQSGLKEVIFGKK